MHQITLLPNQLTEFGLNPFDWIIHAPSTGENKILLQNWDDPDLEIEATLTQEAQQWKILSMQWVC